MRQYRSRPGTMHEISIGNLKWSAKNANFPWLWGPSRGVNNISQYWHKFPAHTFSLVAGLLILTGRPVDQPAGRPAFLSISAGQNWPKLKMFRN